MKDGSYYDVDLIVNFLNAEKLKSGDLISGLSLRYFIEHIGEFNRREAMARRYKALRRRMTKDVEEAVGILISAGKAETKDGANFVLNMDKFFEELENE